MKVVCVFYGLFRVVEWNVCFESPIVSVVCLLPVDCYWIQVAACRGSYLSIHSSVPIWITHYHIPRA